jgi:predicted dehydrogenase/nucleoside-diphosphate-sugar epimerase
MKNEPIKVGLLGAGYILNAHANALRAIPSAKMAAICDISEGRAEKAARQFGIPKVFTSLDEMLQSPVDVVHVLLPPQLHEDAAEKIILAGKSVFMEKPMGPSSERCGYLVKLAKDKGVKLGVDHNFLFAPAYESLRESVRSGACGTIDHVTVNWLYALGLIQLGPFNNWMFQSPGNLLLELGPHSVAYALDLLGPLDDLACKASDPIDLPGHQRVYRHWTILGTGRGASCTINLSVNPGQPDRSLHLRGSSAVGRLDFERGISWIEKAKTNSAIFDVRGHGRAVTKAIARQSASNFRKYLGAVIAKSPDVNAFQESVHLCIEAFYRTIGQGALDPRLDGAFGVEVIRLCERAIASSGVAASSAAAGVEAAPPGVPDTLVIGGTGFIGKRLVARLLKEGRRVSVLTRSRKTGALELEGLPVDIVEGRYDDPALLDRILPGIKTVYHLAKAVGEKWADYQEGDVDPTRVLAEACLRNGVGRFIYTGTVDSYYSADPSVVITGETPLDPRIKRRNNYARSKATCEAVLTKMHAEQGLPLVILRPGIVIGKGCPPAHWGVGMFLSDTLVKYWGKGDNLIPFVLVDDVAEALALAGTQRGIEGRTFLLTDKPMLSAREYVELVQEFSRTPIRQIQVPIWRFFADDFLKEAVKNAIHHPNRKMPSYRDWACRAHRSVYDASESSSALGWKPVGNKAEMVEKGIRAAVDYYYR